MPKIKLTKRVIDSLELTQRGQLFYWDTELAGFGLRINQQTKVYIVQSKINGQTRRVTIGTHGVFAPEQARNEARNKLQEMRKGIDPRIEKARKKAETITLGALAEQYIKDRHLKANSIKDIRKHVNGYFVSWKEQPLTFITRDRVLKRFRELSAKAPTQTNQAFRILRALLNFARATYRPNDTPILPENPCQVISDAKIWNQNRVKSGRIPIEKIGESWTYIQKLRSYPGLTKAGKTGADLLAFLILTGCRFNEAAKLTWDRVDLEAGTWYLPDPKNRNAVTFPLSNQAKEILENRPRGNEFVFTGRLNGHFKDLRDTLLKFEKEIGIRITAHDLRRTFTAIAGECGLELWKVKLLMNHKLHGDVTLNNYTERHDLKYLQPEADKIGKWIEQQAIIFDAENVINLDAKRRQKA